MTISGTRFTAGITAEFDLDADVRSATVVAGHGRIVVGFIVEDEGTRRAHVREFNQP